MWSSFTKDEKKLFIFLLVMLGLGSVLLSYVDQRRKTEVFTVRSDREGASEITRGKQRPSTKNATNSTTDASRPLLDLNTASEADLMKLPGIGKARAAAIVAYREVHGGFTCVEDLKRVHGIGPATLRGLEGLVKVASQASETSGPASPKAVLGSPPLVQQGPSSLPASGAITPSAEVTAPINREVVDVNTATAAELASLDQIGPILAQRIVDYRNRNGRFRRVEDLDKVPGIGKKRIELNRHRLVVR
ncbi:MAG: helix-hairpin-helix domain-containing protein [Candidatus Sumerlaeaceae bacterium]|nr:helix-hairpin-helix domain-containing protein [Candidatus Sumerlaeaceae bacterium]